MGGQAGKDACMRASMQVQLCSKKARHAHSPGTSQPLSAPRPVGQSSQPCKSAPMQLPNPANTEKHFQNETTVHFQPRCVLTHLRDHPLARWQRSARSHARAHQQSMATTLHQPRQIGEPPRGAPPPPATWTRRPDCQAGRMVRRRRQCLPRQRRRGWGRRCWACRAKRRPRVSAH
eukprot:351311-Chlamydomonas_euryale.AAC.5